MLRSLSKILGVPFIDLLTENIYPHKPLNNITNFTKRTRNYYLSLFGLVIPVWSIVPISYIYVLQVIYHLLFSSSNPLGATHQILLFSYSLLEVAFSIEHHIRLHRIQRHVHPVPTTDVVEMKNLFEKCLGTMTKEDITVQFPRWFMSAPFENIRSDNVREWLCWAFCAKDLKDATPDEHHSIDSMLISLESKAQRTFPPGRDHSVKCCRLTLDRIEGLSRPLAFYLAISAIGLGMDMVLRFLWGFQYHTTREGISYWIWTPRKGEDKGKNYNNHNNHKNVDGAPIVFVHGIGIGLASYVPFLSSLRTFANQNNRPIILLTLPHVSMGLVQKAFPDSHTTTTALLGILEKHGFSGQKPTWVGHSLGTVVVGWMCKERKDMIGSLILVDPICFRLWEADLCFNFMYRTPSRASELLMWYFVSREVGVSTVIGRRFWWFQNILFPESLPPSLQTHIFLGAEDRLINPVRVHDYLIRNGVPVTIFPSLGHAGALVVSDKAREKIMECIVEQQELMKTTSQNL